MSLEKSTYFVGDQVVNVIDDYFSQQELIENYRYIKECPFYYYDYSYFSSLDQKQPIGSGTHWIHPVDLDNADNYPIFKKYKSLVLEITNRDLIERSHINCNFTFDIRNPHIDRATLNALVFLTPEWNKSDAGEILFYENDKLKLALEPLPGRVILFDGSILHRGGVPSISSRYPRYTLTTKFKTT